MVDPDESIPSPLATALREYVEARSAALLVARKELAIGELDARALLYLVDHPGARASDLRDYLGITSAGVTTLTDRLVERGAIARAADEDDRRIVRLTSVVDMTTVPWSALMRFDDGIARAIADADVDDVGGAATLLAGLTRSATSVPG